MGIFGKPLIYSAILMLGSLNFGYVISYPSPAMPDMRKQWPDQISSTLYQTFNACSSLFAILGPFICNYCLKRMGRRTYTFINALFSAISWFLILPTKPKIFWYTIFIRCLNGIGMGAYSSIIPMYIVELAPKAHTGFFGSLNQLGVAAGIVMVYLVGNWCSWFKTAIIGGLINVLLCLLIWFVPESPAANEVSQTDQNVESESVFQPKYRKPLLIGIFLMIFQQFSGVNAILTNLSDLFTEAGVNISSGIASAIASSAQLIAVAVVGFLMDFFGRKKLWIFSYSLLVIALFIYSITLKTSINPSVAIVAIFIFMFGFGTGAGPIPWFIIPEIFPASVRSTAQSICSSTNWVCAFIVIFLYKWLVDLLTNFGTMIFFLCVCILSIIFAFMYISDIESKRDATRYENIE